MKSYKRFFIHHINIEFPNDFQFIIQETDTHFSAIIPDIHFIKTSGNPIDKRLEFCAYFLALIKTLDARQISYENIRKICLAITIDYVQPRHAIEAYFKKLIPTLTGSFLGKFLINKFAEKVSVNKSKEGFIAEIIRDPKETFGLGYGVNIIECGICKLFAKHHYEKYASILCEVDEITSGLAGLELIRSGTIANGAKICDFRYKPAGK